MKYHIITLGCPKNSVDSEGMGGILAAQGHTAVAQPGDADWKRFDELAEKFGFYEYNSKEVVDYHTFNIIVPGGLFRAAAKDRPPSVEQPRMLVVVKCESRTQFLGVAKNDLYLLAGDQPFAANFLKGEKTREELTDLMAGGEALADLGAEIEGYMESHDGHPPPVTA